jgi:hypothetical protein
MKFQKGLVSEAPEPETVGIKIDPNVRLKPVTQQAHTIREVDKNRLFETTEKVTSSSRNYLKVLGLVGVVVLIAVGAAFYFMEPGVGDRIVAPRGAEIVVRDHFLLSVKRTATDVVFFKCDGFYWARVGVETRTDLDNPLMRIAAYKAKVSGQGEGTWQVTEATPITSPDLDIPCR